MPTHSSYASLFLLCLLWGLFVLVQYVSVYFSLFWYFWWLDIVMHTYGGILIVASWFMVRSLGAFPAFVSGPDTRSLLILTALIFGWEAFELAYGLVTPHYYIQDTVLDIVLGYAGGLVAFYLFHSRTIETS